jgi:hypothetical protein
MARFTKYKRPMSQPLSLENQEGWRTKFAADVIKLAQESAGRDDFLQSLSEAMAAIGHKFVKVGSGGTRAAFALPLGLVAKLRVVELIGTGTTNRPPLSPNAAELERSQMFPAFVPRVYGECYRAFAQEDFDESIDLLIVERVIPLAEFTDHLTVALGSTNTANLGVCPRSGRVMVLDVGSAWSPGVEESFLDRSHPLMQFPFMWAPRW